MQLLNTDVISWHSGMCWQTKGAKTSAVKNTEWFDNDGHVELGLTSLPNIP